MKSLTIAVVIAAFCLCSQSAQASAGTLIEAVGLVQVQKTGAGPFMRADIGQQVRPGDVLRTGRDAKARLLLKNNSFLNFAADTEFQLGEKLTGTDEGFVGTLLRGVARAVLKGREASYIATPTTSIGIRGTDVTLTHSNRSGVFFLEDGGIVVGAGQKQVYLNAGQMTASYKARPPLPPADFARSSGLEKAHSTLSGLTSMTVPPSLKKHALFNEIMARWLINYAHYLADAGQPGHAATALLLAEDLTHRHEVESAILLQAAGLYFYRLQDAREALRAYRRIIREYRNTPQFKRALFGAFRCFSLLGHHDKAREYGMWYRRQFPEDEKNDELDVLTP